MQDSLESACSIAISFRSINISLVSQGCRVSRPRLVRDCGSGGGAGGVAGRGRHRSRRRRRAPARDRPEGSRPDWVGVHAHCRSWVQSDETVAFRLPAGAVREVLPIAMHVTNPVAGFYVRTHRRHGTRERIYPADEVAGGNDGASNADCCLEHTRHHPCFYLLAHYDRPCTRCLGVWSWGTNLR